MLEIKKTLFWILRTRFFPHLSETLLIRLPLGLKNVIVLLRWSDYVFQIRKRLNECFFLPPKNGLDNEVVVLTGWLY